MVRPTWIDSHPPACTCVACEERRAISRLYGKVGRNAQCPCGSGKKYKRCHGK